MASTINVPGASVTLKREREPDNSPGLKSKKHKTGKSCTAKGCSAHRYPGLARCSAHAVRCERCRDPIARGKLCGECKDAEAKAEKTCVREGCHGSRLPRKKTCLAHTLHCRVCKKPAKRGQPCSHCTNKNSKGKDDSRRWVHEGWARQIIEHAFWPNRAPKCVKCNRSKLCAKCKSIESCRAYYTDRGRKRWFDFDIVLKVPVAPGGIPTMDKNGHPVYRIVAVVEVDGPSHYKAIKFGKAKSDIEDQQRRDKLKRAYCKKMGIGLFRIPCYFTRKGSKDMRPNKPMFIKLVYKTVHGMYKMMRAGKFGPDAQKMLAKHWNPNWFRHPKANP